MVEAMVEVTGLHAFEDNYIWLLQNRENTAAAVVDPGDEDPVLEALDRHALNLNAVLITHKHGDHTGGIRGLKSAFPNARIFGPKNEPIRGLTDPLSEGAEVEIEDLDVVFKVMELPGHTEGHIAYYGGGKLFCGDVLFAAGCGRVFSGTHEQHYHSLQRIARLPPETEIYCAHEYTLDNLGFAEWVEPNNSARQAREQETRLRRELDEPTVPSLLQLELETNPFLRPDQPLVRAAAERYSGKSLSSDLEVFTTIRRWKDMAYD